MPGGLVDGAGCGPWHGSRAFGAIAWTGFRQPESDKFLSRMNADFLAIFPRHPNSARLSSQQISVGIRGKFFNGTDTPRPEQIGTHLPGLGDCAAIQSGRT
jgi:hypothetical protein